MRKTRFTEHQLIAVLKSVEAGHTVKDVCREAGIPEASYYNWKAKFSGMESSDIKKMKDLKYKNRRPKQMFADLTLECRALKDVIKKATKPARKPELVGYLTAQFVMSIRWHAGRYRLVEQYIFTIPIMDAATPASFRQRY